MTCWSCHEKVGGMLCVSCGLLQPPPVSPDAFVVFGIKPWYHLDLSVLEEQYRKLARQLHPDRYSGKSATERRFSLQWTAHLNEARRILKDPVRRARLLATGSPDPKETGGPKLDPAFLQEMFDWREEEEETPGALRERATARSAALEAELEGIFTAWEEGHGGLEWVDDRLARLKYIKGLLPARL